MIGGHIHGHMLETSRVCSQNYNENNFHVFYSLLFGASIDLKKSLYFENIKNFKVNSNGINIKKKKKKKTLDTNTFIHSI